MKVQQGDGGGDGHTDKVKAVFRGRKADGQLIGEHLHQTVRRLEKEIGTEFFWKDGRKIRLTEGGRTFYGRVVNILRELDEAASQAGGHRENLQGNINIGTYMSIEPLLECMRLFAEENPDVTFTIHQINSLGREEHSFLDVLLCYDHSDLLGFNEVVRLDTVAGEYVLPADHPAPGESGRYTLMELKDDYFVTLIWEDGTYEEVFNDFHHGGISIKARYRTNSSLVKKEILEAGLAVGVSNQMLTSTFRNTGRYFVTARLPEEHEVGIMLVWRDTDTLSPAACAFKRFTLERLRPVPLTGEEQAKLRKGSHAL